MPPKRIVVVHDVLGTLFSLGQPIAQLKQLFADQLRDAPPSMAEMIVMDWYHSAQRDFTTLSLQGAYQPIANVFRFTLPRVLLQAGLQPPATATKPYLSAAGPAPAQPGSSSSSSSSDADAAAAPFDTQVVDAMMASLRRLEPRPGMVEAMRTVYRDPSLRPSGVEHLDVWGATNGGVELARALFQNALAPGSEAPPPAAASVVLPRDRERFQSDEAAAAGAAGAAKVALFSCDEVQVAKPDARVYEAVKQRIGVRGEGQQGARDDSLWFVASHTWDTFAAKKAGFKTAWVNYEEFVPCDAIYGKPDVQGSDLAEVARRILEYETKAAQA